MELFNDAYNALNAAEDRIDYNPEWRDRHGQYTNACYLVTLRAGAQKKALSDTGQKLLFIGTELGTVVMFNAKQGDDSNIAFHAPSELVNLLGISSQACSTGDLKKFIGDPNGSLRNIGVRLNIAVHSVEKKRYIDDLKRKMKMAMRHKSLVDIGDGQRIDGNGTIYESGDKHHNALVIVGELKGNEVFLKAAPRNAPSDVNVSA